MPEKNGSKKWEVDLCKPRFFDFLFRQIKRVRKYDSREMNSFLSNSLGIPVVGFEYQSSKWRLSKKSIIIRFCPDIGLDDGIHFKIKITKNLRYAMWSIDADDKCKRIEALLKLMDEKDSLRLSGEGTDWLHDMNVIKRNLVKVLVHPNRNDIIKGYNSQIVLVCHCGHLEFPFNCNT